MIIDNSIDMMELLSDIEKAMEKEESFYWQEDMQYLIDFIRKIFKISEEKLDDIDNKIRDEEVFRTMWGDQFDRNPDTNQKDYCWEKYKETGRNIEKLLSQRKILEDILQMFFEEEGE